MTRGSRVPAIGGRPVAPHMGSRSQRSTVRHERDRYRRSGARRLLDGVALALALAACATPRASANAHASASAAPANSPAAAPPPQRLSLSASGGCWLRDGRVWCWTAPAEPRTIDLPAAAIDAAGSLRFGCAVLATGAVHCWGDNTWGQLGAASSALRSDAPLEARGVGAATSIAVAVGHACATLKDGSVVCWGNNAAGQCGHDREYAPAVRKLVLPERVEGVSGARRVVVSASSSCALGDDVTWCWGELLRASDGSGPPSDRTRATPIAPLARARSLALGNECGCALTTERRVACFALTRYGCPSADVRAGLEPLFGWSDVRALAVGDRGACAERETDGVACWSHASREPRLDAPLVPVPRALAPPMRGIPAIADGPCVLAGGALACWSSAYWDEPSALGHDQSPATGAGGAGSEGLPTEPLRLVLP